MGLQQQAILIVADDIGKQLIVVTDCGQALSDAFVLALQDIHHGEWKDPLRRFLKGCIEDLVQFVTGNQRGDAGCRDPDQRQGETEPESKTPLKTARPSHPRPSR